MEERFLTAGEPVSATADVEELRRVKTAEEIATLRRACDLADRGWNIVVFPEGQTTEDGRIAPFRAGVGLLAKQLNIPIVPMRLAGLFDLRQKNQIFARPGHVQVIIGKPVSFTAEQDVNDITKELERRVMEL